MPEGRLERTRQAYGAAVVLFRDMPLEIVVRYEDGEREIVVSREVFKAYGDALTRRNGFITRLSAGAFNQPPTLMYKDARVIRMK